MEIGCIDQNNIFCKLHSNKYLNDRNQIPELTHTSFSIHSPHQSFVYLPYVKSKQDLYSDYNHYQIPDNNKLNNNNNVNTQSSFQRPSLFGCGGNILRQKNGSECSHTPIGWQNEIPQCQYGTRNPSRSYRCEQSRIGTLSNFPWNRNVCNTKENESRVIEKINCRPTTQPQITQKFFRVSKIDMRPDANNSENHQKPIINQCSYGRREPFNTRTQRFNDRYFQKDTITGEPLPISRRSTEYNQDDRFFDRNSYNITTPETEMQEKNDYCKTIMQNEYEPPHQESYINESRRPIFNNYCETGNGISQLMSGNRKSIQEEIPKISGRTLPYETLCNNSRNQESNCRRSWGELQQFNRKDNEKIDCSCCCYINNDCNHHNKDCNNHNSGSFNPFNINSSHGNYDDLKKHYNVNDLNQFRNKMKQRLLGHKHYCSDSDRAASDDDFDIMLLNSTIAERKNKNNYANINESNANTERLSSINENPSWKYGRNILQDRRSEGDGLQTPNSSNTHISERNVSSNLNSSDDDSYKYRRSILQGRRGEGGRILKPNLSIDHITNSSYTSNGRSSDDETFNFRRSILQRPRNEGGKLPNSSIDPIANRSRTSSLLSSDDEPSLNSRRSILQGARGEGGRFFKQNSIDHITDRTYSSNVLSSDYEPSLNSRRSMLQCNRDEGGRFLKPNAVDRIYNRRYSPNVLSLDDISPEPRRSILQGPRGEGGRLLTPNSSANFLSNSSRRSNLSSSEDESFFKSLPRTQRNSSSSISNRSRNSNISNDMFWNREKSLQPHLSNLQTSNVGRDNYFSNINTKTNHRSNLSSSEDEASFKPLPRIYEGQRGGALFKRSYSKLSFRNKRNNSSNQLLSDDETLSTPQRIINVDNARECCSSSNSCFQNKSRSTSKMVLPVHQITLTPRRSILQSSRGEGGGFLKRTDSKKSMSYSRTSSLYLSSDDDSKNIIRIKYSNVKDNDSSKSPDFKTNFKPTFEFPCCPLIDKEKPIRKKNACHISYHGINNSFSSRSTPIQSTISRTLPPIRRTNSATINRVLPTNGYTASCINHNIRKSELIDLNGKGDPSIFQCIKTLEKLTTNVKPKPGLGKKPANRTVNSRQPISFRNMEIKSSAGGYFKAPNLGFNKQPKKQNNISTNKTIRKPFKC